jgi:hypothetical protein
MATQKKATAKKAAPKKAAPKRKQQTKHIRNLRNVHVSLHAKGRRIELAPRGQRGDIVTLERGDQSDQKFMGDQGVLFELITKADADKAVEKQATNMTQARHPALDIIRNSQGDEYGENAVRLEEESEAQGKVVAELDGEEQRGTRFEWGVGIRRAAVPGSADRATPDIPDSVAPEDQAAYRLEHAEEQARLADELARNKALEGPAAGLGGLKVTKENTQRT